MADHGGAAAEKAQTYFALVGFLARVDAEVVRELARVCEVFTAIPAAVPFLSEPGAAGYGPGGAAVRRKPGGELKTPLNHFVLHAESQARVETCASRFTRAARLQRGGR